MAISPRLFRRAVIMPGLDQLATVINEEDGGFAWADRLCFVPQLQVMLLAVALQESRLEHRVQIGSLGQELPQHARGWWQCERSGCSAVLNNAQTAWLHKALVAYGLSDPTTTKLHELVRDVDVIAVWTARALLWAVPQPLPDMRHDQREVAWEQYLLGWNPGKPRKAAWMSNWSTAVVTVRTAYGMPEYDPGEAERLATPLPMDGVPQS